MEHEYPTRLVIGKSPRTCLLIPRSGKFISTLMSPGRESRWIIPNTFQKRPSSCSLITHHRPSLKLKLTCSTLEPPDHPTILSADSSAMGFIDVSNVVCHFRISFSS